MRGDPAEDPLTDLQGGVGDHLGAPGEVDQPPQGHRVLDSARRPEGPGLEPRLERVDLGFEVQDLLGEGLAVEQHRAVGEVHRELAHVLHQHHRVHRAFEVRGVGLGRVRREVGLAGGALIDPRDPLVRSSEQHDVGGFEFRFVVRVQDPLAGPSDRDGPDPRLGFEVQPAEGLPGEPRVGVDAGAHEGLDRLGERRPDRVGQPDVLEDDLRDVAGRVGDLLGRAHDPQHRGERLGVVGGARGHQQAHVGSELEDVHLGFELENLLGDLVAVEEHRRVRQIDHELGDVLHLREESLDAARLVVDLACHARRSSGRAKALLAHVRGETVILFPAGRVQAPWQTTSRRGSMRFSWPNPR